MVSEQCSSAQIVSALGNTSDRSVCFRSKQENTSVLHMVSQSVGSSDRHTVNCVGKHGSIHISPNLSHTKGITAHEEISVSDNTHNPTVAKETLVYTNLLQMLVACPRKLPLRQDLLVQPKTRIFHPKPEIFNLTAWLAVNRSFQSKGFSEDTRKLMVASWRSGTWKDYSIKFKKFNSWCCEWEIDLNTATLTNCADFLSSLFQTGLKYRTILGYRSMLSVMLPQINGYPVGQHPDILRLLKGVFNSRPPVKQLVPEWDLQKVLDLLSNPPFEPMNKISLKCVTWKTFFLTPISTFRWCSDIQALRMDVGFMNILSEGVFSSEKDCLNKTDLVTIVRKFLFLVSRKTGKWIRKEQLIFICKEHRSLEVLRMKK